MNYLRLPNFKNVPDNVFIELTRNCNLNCLHCANSSNKSLKNELTDDEIFRLIDHLSEINVFSVVLTGGEPFLRKSIFELIDYLNQKKILVKIATNGLLINEKIAKKLSEYKISGVQISLDSSNKEKHDSFRRVNGSFNKALNAIKFLSNNGIKVTTGMTVTNNNYNEIEDVINLSIKNGAKSFLAVKYIPTGRGLESKLNMLDLKKSKEFSYKILNLSKKYEKKIYISEDDGFCFLLKKERKDLFCPAGISSCVIEADGNVHPCQFIGDRSLVSGNIREKNFIDIWLYSKNLREFRSIQNLNKKCNNCEHLNICMGGCKGMTYGYYNSYDYPDPYCWNL
ncbi:radical SAM/SPASM domain-containing protein [Tepiditoga spiralis]|uniref:Radical SAM/SPASM domain-containing protein n=1 Tax=Tepiditoga spiralis TaxID=2108365 RepID=A0A7G1G4D2_9BACT|nr:radical SAM protein [Tepiditoga spiralis]BBE30076.1 radical SAM/SPASM domain-containing protein [Tepiditoga spiralis]